MERLNLFEQKNNLVFKDKDLLKQAFVHRSYLNENKGFDLIIMSGLSSSVMLYSSSWSQTICIQNFQRKAKVILLRIVQRL